MKVLVTGATSLIGQHVVRRLMARGDHITVLQRNASAIAGVAECRCDLASDDPSAITVLEQALTGCETVVHLAAKVSFAGRREAFDALNIEGTRRLVAAAARHGVSRFVHVSTPSVAHAGQSLTGAAAGPAAPAQVRGHYARSKAVGEQIALAANDGPLRVVALRPHLVWGPGDTQLIQRIVDRARAGRLVLVGNGQALIDTTYIDNAAAAIVAAIDSIERAAGRALVVSNGQPRTVSEIMHRILEAAGITTRLRQVPAPLAIAAGSAIEGVWSTLDRRDEPPMTRFLAEQLATAHWFDQRETQMSLDWQPAIGLEEGFARLADSMTR